MTIRSTHLSLALTLLASLCCGAALAQGQAHPSGLYIGLSGGQSRAHPDADAWARRALAGTTSAQGLSSDSRDRAYRLFLGQQMNRHWALELGYFELGRFGLQAATRPTGTLNARMKLRGAALDWVGTLPMGDTLDLLFRVGAQHARNRSDFSGNGTAPALQGSHSERGWGYKAGLGVQAALGPRLLLRAEAEQYRVPAALDGNMKLRVLSVSLVMPLGGPAAAPRQALLPSINSVHQPASVHAAAPPAPPRTLQRVSFAAESLFGFDRSELGAEAVKTHLVSSGGLAASKISAAGLGEDRPSTQPGDCQAGLPTQALRDCLQPDRRVEVGHQGSR